MTDVNILNPNGSSDRPFVTFALFTYNQEKYGKEAIESAFAQTYENLEIIISDDCSTDATYEIIQNEAASYAGSHKLILRQSSVNHGFARNVSDVCEIAKGDLIIAAAGDDKSFSNRTLELVNAWEKYGKKSGSLYSNFRTLFPNGRITNSTSRNSEWHITHAERKLDFLNDFAGISGCAHAWTRDIFDQFGPIDNRIDHEDVIIPLRSLLIGTITFIPLDLVDYRISTGSITRKRYTSPKERLSQMDKYWRGRTAIFEQFKIDTKRAIENEWVSENDIRWLCDTSQKAEEFARSMQLFYSTNTIERLRILMRVSNKISLKTCLKLLLISLFPILYNFRMPRWLRLQLWI
jgi:glycosyltransferase involved in cell wall biosynthesis